MMMDVGGTGRYMDRCVTGCRKSTCGVHVKAIPDKTIFAF